MRCEEAENREQGIGNGTNSVPRPFAFVLAKGQDYAAVGYPDLMPFSFPKIYPILDSSFIDASVIPATGRQEFLRRLGSGLAEAGATLLEYRNKTGSDAEILQDAAALRSAMPKIKLILDDRADLVEQAGFDGVHVDTGDVSPSEARRLLGPDRIVGTFGGSDALLPGILDAPADYWAVGPVFTTTTKQTSKAPIGVEGVRKLREQAGSKRILTAAAGITLETAPAVLAAGASAVAVAAAIFRTADPAREFRRWQTTLG
jgi:thiamine-phosphate pyrophosphorylase